jgi:hypothetical protein
MKNKKDIGLDFIIDKLTNSIENVLSGDSFQTEISILSSNDIKTISKKNGWFFDWKIELKNPTKEVYKLTIIGNQSIIQGLISIEVKSDHVYMHLIESAPFNKGKSKVYNGVPGNLVAFACKLSFQRGFQGAISFLSKSQLIEHYTKTLGAFHLSNRVMIIETREALKLIGKYFPNSI